MKIKITICLTIFFMLFSSVCIAADSVFVWSSSVAQTVQTSNLATSTDLELESSSAILIDQNSGTVLYEHNSHEALRPASVTKIMSILLIMEALDGKKISLEDAVPCSENARSMGGSQIWLNETEKLTVNDMLKAICVVSANDCTVAMSEYLCGSQEAFVQKMNEKAKQLGMNDTTFKNCHGIDEDGHVTSAYDISLMSRELLSKHPSITNYTTLWMDTLRDGKSQLVNTNKLVRNYDGCTGLKTGSTSLALYNLSASATRNELSLIAVIMKAPTTAIRFNEAKKLLDYGFANFEYCKFASAGNVVKSIPVQKGLLENVNAVFSKDAGAITLKGQSSSVVQSINIPDFIQAPITQGQKIGEVTYSLNDTILATIDIIADAKIEKMSFINMSSYLYYAWFSLFR